MRFPLCSVGVVLALALAACGGTAAPSAPSQPAASAPAATSAPKPAATPDKVTVRMDFLLTGWDAGYWVAVDKGFYKQLNLDVTPEEGKGTTATIDAVAHGNDTFGQVDGGPLIVADSQGLPIVGVASLFKDSPNALVVPESSSIKSVKDLKGKQIGLSAANSTAQLLPAVLAFNGMTRQDVKEVNMDNNAIVPSLLQHRVDAVATFGIGLGAAIDVQGMPIRILAYNDNGLHQPGFTIATTPAYAKAHPDVVKRFIQGTRQGWDYAKAHPDEAVAIELKSFPQANQKVLLTQLKLSLPFWNNPVGGSFELQQYDTAAQELLKYGVIKKAVPASQVVTNEYVTQ